MPGKPQRQWFFRKLCRPLLHFGVIERRFVDVFNRDFEFDRNAQPPRSDFSHLQVATVQWVECAGENDGGRDSSSGVWLRVLRRAWPSGYGLVFQPIDPTQHQILPRLRRDCTDRFNLFAVDQRQRQAVRNAKRFGHGVQQDSSRNQFFFHTAAAIFD